MTQENNAQPIENLAARDSNNDEKAQSKTNGQKKDKIVNQTNDGVRADYCGGEPPRSNGVGGGKGKQP